MTRASVIVADILVIAVTWVRLRRQVNEASKLDIATTISTVMLTDGGWADISYISR